MSCAPATRRRARSGTNVTGGSGFGRSRGQRVGLALVRAAGGVFEAGGAPSAERRRSPATEPRSKRAGPRASKTPMHAGTHAAKSRRASADPRCSRVFAGAAAGHSAAVASGRRERSPSGQEVRVCRAPTQSRCAYADSRPPLLRRDTRSPHLRARRREPECDLVTSAPVTSPLRPRWPASPRRARERLAQPRHDAHAPCIALGRPRREKQREPRLPCGPDVGENTVEARGVRARARTSTNRERAGPRASKDRKRDGRVFGRRKAERT
jgi:hypothetical protein